jgi:two-component system, sensor histidine kinase
VNDTRQKALAMGVNEFVSKPLQANDLQRALQRCGLLDEPGSTSPTEPARPEPPETEPANAAIAAPATASADGVDLAEVMDVAAYTEIVSMLPQETVVEMLDSLLAPPQGTLHALLAALHADDMGNTAFVAHNLKGTSMLMGFRAIAQTAAQIEQLARQPNADLPADFVARLQQNLADTQQALRQYDALHGA